MYPPLPNPAVAAGSPKFGEKDLVRRSASTISPPAERQQQVAKLIDVSKCIGCKACQSACMEWNDLREEIGTSNGTYNNPLDLTPAWCHHELRPRRSPRRCRGRPRSRRARASNAGR